MSYMYIEAHVLPNTLAPQWRIENIKESRLLDVFSRNREIVIKLEHNGEEIYVDFNQFRAEFATYQNTLATFLLSLEGKTVEKVQEPDFNRIDYIRYEDAYRVGYATKLTKIGVHFPNEYPKSELSDVELFRPGKVAGAEKLHSQCLLSVNGYYHATDSDGTRSYIVDAGKTAEKSKVCLVGITSFQKLGSLSKYKINDADLSREKADRPLKERVFLKLPGELEKKSFFLVLGGYLVFPKDGVLWQVNDDTAAIDLTRLPYIERLLESSQSLDLSSLGLTESELNPENINLEEAWSDAVIRKYFQLSQSFIVVVDREGLFWAKKVIRQILAPGMFTSWQEPTYPLIVGHGRLAEYWKTMEGGYWSVNVLDNWYRNYLFSRHQQQKTVKNVTGMLSFDRPFEYSQGLLLEIGATGPRK